MDDNTEVNMDTDVSSTTADIPEIEDVSSGNSQVETVIVVEKLDEGTEKEMSSAIANELSQEECHNEVEVESCFLRSSSDEVSTNDSDVKEVQNTSEFVESNNDSITVEPVATDTDKAEKIQDQVTTTRFSPTKVAEATCDLNQAVNPVNSCQNVSQVGTVSNLAETPIIPEIGAEKKSPIKKLELEDIQTTFIEISKGSNELNAIKKEEAPSSVDSCEKSNDSHVDSISDISEKEHVKSISRELKSLMKSAKESKIISECTQLTSKTRKSRSGLDSYSSTLSSSPSIDVEKIHGRRNSNNSQLSNSSEQSDKTPMKRSMRSQNPEFVHKVKQFLNSVTGRHQKSDSDDEGDEGNKYKSNTMSPSAKKKRQSDNQVEVMTDGKMRSDLYCWRCHWQVEQVANEKTHVPMHCTACPRSYHFKCLTVAERNKIETDKSWVCPECLSILHAECSDTRSLAMKKITLGSLCELLQHALQRMMELNGVEPFLKPVDRTAFPDYDKYVVNPMDLARMKENVAAGVYGSTEAFTADVQWILHNSVIFNTVQSKLTGGARALMRTCRSEMGEIEACPECYAAAHARRPTWFIDVCTTPHILLWAKLKGFPFWPAKGMSVNSSGLVDVRFFGAHDRAWVPARDCFLYSEKDPNSFRTKRQDIIDSMQEAEQHIRNISRKYGKFVYPPFKTTFDPSKLYEHLKAMIPSFEGEVRSSYKEKANTSLLLTPKNKRRSGSKSSKQSNNDGDNSESEDSQIVTSRKMADGVEIAPDEEDFSVDKDSTIEIETPKKEGDARKRRRSLLEEAVITIMENSSSGKKKRVDEGASSDSCTNKTKSDCKEIKEYSKANTDTTDSNKEVREAPTSAESQESEKPPIKTVIRIRPSKTSTPKEKDDKVINPKQKPSTSTEKIGEKEKVLEKEKVAERGTPDSGHTKSVKRTEKRKSSKHSSPIHLTVERRNSDKRDKDASTSRDKHNQSRSKETEMEKSNAGTSKEEWKTSKKSKDTEDKNAVFITRNTSKSNGLPTISSVRSLSTAQPNTSQRKTIEITIEAKSDSSVFTPTSTDSVRNMKEAASKLDKLKGDKPPAFGRVGVRAFARMKSPEQRQAKESIEVEIKSEPMDFDDADRQSEKMDLMNAFCLRPVNPPVAPKLRDVRINKVVSGPPAQTQVKAATKPPEPRPKARKSFPQPRKPDEGRSELNGKNSMVYIPIQPPTSQAPVRPTRPATVSNTNTLLRPPLPTATITSNGNMNTAPAPVMPVVTSSPAIPTSSPAVTLPVSKSNLPVGQLPTVHTVPYITSVNGQCFFSLQPIMSVGGVENPGGVVGDVASPVLGAPPLPVLQAPAPAVAPQTNGNDDADKLSQEAAASQMPRLQQRPAYYNPLDATAPVVSATPSTAGPLATKLNQHAAKMTNLFRTLLEDSIERWDDPAAQLTALKLQLETLKWRSQQEIKEMKHNYDLTISEMRGSFEKEKSRAVAEAWRSAHAEMETAVKAAKGKQWCANCGVEAHYYCCWNTTYCDYPCQRAHWKQHGPVCTQERPQDNNNGNCSNLERRLQAAPDNVPTLQKSTVAPALTVGGKVAPVRMPAAKDQPLPPNKSSIIVSMVDDKSGSPTLKCVGTYKAGASQISPLILNNQIMNNEENNQKKMVKSGGYLIVGSGSNTPLVTPRRTQTIQYYQ